MAKFVYRGQPEAPEEASAVVQTLGHVFPLNVPVDVFDEAAIRKLRGNPTFVEVADEGAPAKRKIIKPVASEPVDEPLSPDPDDAD